MKPRLVFWLVAVAFAAWLALVLAARGASGGEPTPTESGPEPTVPPPTDSVPPPAPLPKEGRVAALERRLAASNAARRRERRSFRRRLRYLIHAPELRGHWLERAFLCIHAGEGSWSANTGNSYFGGLQMDISFQRTYAGWALRTFGTADRWPASVQVATAIQAWASGRGFRPWPNTARACGLL